MKKSGAYTIPKGSGFKTYTVSGIHTENGFGTKDVIKVANNNGNERFYVMALSDVDSSSYQFWYSSTGAGTSVVTSTDFGTGESNTAAMKTKSGSSSCLWGLSEVQSGTWNGSKGWYVPAREEWAAFGAAFGITSSNYGNYDLSDGYWSSSQSTLSSAWDADFERGYMYNDRTRYGHYVRLGTTF